MEDQWITLDEDTNVTIVNRKKSYEISKQKLSSIPYFVKLFSHSNCDTTKIELDLDESSFDNIIEFILDNHLSISIESALSMVETADYLGMDEIKQKYYDFYKSNFNIKSLEEFLDFYEKRKSPEMFTVEKLNSFIGKYFLPISHTIAFRKFSVSLLERILKLKLIVSYEYQIVEAIDRWIKFDEKERNQCLPRLIKLVNLCHLKDSEMAIVTAKLKNSELAVDTSHSPHACLPKFCQSDCKIDRHYYKSLISVFELDEDKINIRRLCLSSHLWTKYGQFTRDETMSTSLIEADHIVDIIYDSGRKGIRVDLISKKFKYLKMFGGDDSYYGQVYRYITHDTRPKNTCVKIKNSSESRYARFIVQRLEAISLGDHLEGICYGHGDHIDSIGFGDESCSDESIFSDDSDCCEKSYYYLQSLDYRKLSCCEFQAAVQTRSCLLLKQNNDSELQKVLYILTKRDFRRQFLLEHKSNIKLLDHLFLKEFIEAILLIILS
ncbi:uncharacterized protein LOC128388286 [Panonychus citri]|uniref:uncharacterized protein LOC128388286 n=1 Tax=Panonychus citri TaxID=50023 RepID=UPI0023075121|nr:uncharacterized protein LOC128388286 [Panonychus citri]